MKDDISKTLKMEFINRFTKQVSVTVIMPYLPYRAQKGYYSNLYTKLKDVSAYDCEKELMYGKVTWLPRYSKRTIISFSNGISLDVPYDLTKTDIQIINLHIEGLKLLKTI